MIDQVQAPRHDMYRMIHKALRAYMADTLMAAGTMDTDDDAATAAALGRIRDLLVFCAGHLDHENVHVHPAMEAREPGSSRHASDDHAHHDAEFSALEADIVAVETSRGDVRAVAAHALYHRLAVFVGENYVHMNIEETHNNAVLWRCYSDAELQAIEHGIIVSETPENMDLTVRWMLAAANPSERAALERAMAGMARAA
ncbi:hypothetical protein N825_10625 [Skermanella stibiiresistens SB22]|uniref:Hemerythrin-like domain-containing protein n=1 Tax=Skermanella stibiiresistens SB22 TaxID=1385369 RepID=W9GYM6_9PROT|nr:hypothetical protein [Skermanella stibiiresistens]EWY38924.1 hypothetical protein N825_10625 [Skermanella stibiiresistens SB22]